MSYGRPKLYKITTTVITFVTTGLFATVLASTCTDWQPGRSLLVGRTWFKPDPHTHTGILYFWYFNPL